MVESLQLQDRVDRYFQAFPKAPEKSINVIQTPDGLGKITGTWEIGRLFQGSKYYGSFPGNFLRRVSAMFPEPPENTLHLFSGSLPAGRYFKADGKIQDLTDPKHVFGDAADLYRAFREHDLGKAAKIRLILADPPYSQVDAVKYGFKKLVNYKAVLGECHKLLEPGGWLLWLATRAPIYANKNWRMSFLVPIYCGTNKIIRALWGFQKKGGSCA